MTKYLQSIALMAVVGWAGQSFVMAQEQVPGDRKTTITIDEPMQIPTMTLQPGTYVVKRLDDDANRHVIQFFDKGGMHLITTLLAMPNSRLKPTGKSVFTFWEVPAGQPKALRAWFYPGDNDGQEFAYPKVEAARISANNGGAKVPVDEKASDTSASSASAEPATAASANATAAVAEPAASPAPTPAPSAPAAAPVEVAAQTSPAPAAVNAPAPANTVADNHSDAQQVSQTTPDTLPKTASNVPLIALFGVLAIVAALALNFAYRRA